MADIVHLGDALDLLEALLVGSDDLGIPAPNPLLGIGLGVDPTKPIDVVGGLFVERALDRSDFLVDKAVAVSSPATVNTDRGKTMLYAIAEDTIVVDLVSELPLVDKTTDQRPGRNDAAKLDNDIRGRLVSDAAEAAGLKFEWVNTTRRLALDTGKAGSAPYGSARHIVTTSIYKMTRIESLTGGPA